MAEVKCIVWVEKTNTGYSADVDVMIDDVACATTFSTIEEMQKNALEVANFALEEYGESVSLEEIVFVFKN